MNMRISRVLGYPIGSILLATLFFALTDSAGGQSAPGTIVTVAGGGPRSNVTATSASIGSPADIALDALGNYYIASDQCSVFKVDTTGNLTRVVGNDACASSLSVGDGGPASQAEIMGPGGITVDSGGNLFISDSEQVRRVDAVTSIITTVAGISFGQISPSRVAIDAVGNLFFAEYANNRVRKVDKSTGVITTVAGNGTGGFSGDGGLATAAQLNSPSGVALDGSGNLFIADSANERVRRISASTGIITTVVGNGVSGSSGDGGPATSANLHGPDSVILDSANNILIVDFGNQRVRQPAATRTPPANPNSTYKPWRRPGATSHPSSTARNPCPAAPRRAVNAPPTPA